MESRDIEEAVAKAVEEDMIRTVVGVSIPEEVALQGLAVIKEFAEYISEAGELGNQDAITGIMCTLIDMALFDTEETDISRMMKIKSTWLNARYQLIGSEICAKCLNTYICKED